MAEASVRFWRFVVSGRGLGGVVLGLAALALSAGWAGAETVALQLKWKHQFQFAGYYAAIEKGFFKARGLDVVVRELGDGQDVIRTVTGGGAQYGIAASDLVLARARGEPVVALAAIYQHSPLVLLARPEIGSVHELRGRTVMLEAHAEELVAYLHDEGLLLEDLRVLPHAFSPSALASGAVDAISAYSTDELFVLQKAGVEVNLFSPRSGGIDFYGDVLFTTLDEARNRPERARAFIAAAREGWEYALAHPEEIADLILARHSTRHSREHLLFEAERSRRLILPDIVEIGHMHPGRWRHIADTYARLGLMERAAPPDDFLFGAAPERLPGWVAPAGLAAFLVTALLAGLTVRSYRLAHRLAQEIEERRALQAELERLAGADPLTGLANRRSFFEALELELARAARTGRRPAMLVMDLDRFKAINDRHGHLVGDAVLIAFAEVLRESVRAADRAARIGGEEFAVLLPETDAADALRVAERIRQTFAGVITASPAGEVRATVSIGAARARVADTVEDLYGRADAQVLRAKRDGRDRCLVDPVG